MLVRPLPGVDPTDLLATLQRLQCGVGNARTAGNLPQTYLAYTAWANEATRALRGRVSPSDVDRLVLTRRYWLMQSTYEGWASTGEPWMSLLQVELDERYVDLEDAVISLRSQIERWSRPGVFVVPDTSVCFNADKLEEWDVGGVLGVREAPVHLLFPMVVIDELDRLKESSDKRKRWRASYTLAVLDRVLSFGTTAKLRAADFSAVTCGGIPRGEVTVEIVLDPPGHARLPIDDDEIIDRVLAIQSLAGRDVTLITYDTGQSHRARNSGLTARKLEREPEPEPESESGSESRGGRRR